MPLPPRPSGSIRINPTPPITALEIEQMRVQAVYAPVEQSVSWNPLHPPPSAPTMGRRVYRQLATVMQHVHGMEPLSGTAETMWHNTCIMLANMCANDSPNFEEGRFLDACQPGAEVNHIIRR